MLHGEHRRTHLQVGLQAYTQAPMRAAETALPAPHDFNVTNVSSNITEVPRSSVVEQRE